jgi:hypothetical protein
MMQVSIPADTGNDAARRGTLAATVQKLVENMKPEAAHFLAINGERTGFIVFDLKDTSQIPAIAEPWFLAFNAKVMLYPVMNAQDLANAAPGIEKAVKEYGKAAGA